MTEYTVKQLVYNHEKAFLPEKAEGVDAVIQYRLTGDQAGDYIIIIEDGGCKVAEGIAAGADDYVAKPVTFGQILTTIRQNIR